MLFASLLFQLHLLKDHDAKSVACIASVVQQLLETLLAVLIDIYFKARRSLTVLVMTFLDILYTVASFQIQLRCPFLSKLSGRRSDIVPGKKFCIVLLCHSCFPVLSVNLSILSL